ncbi:MAG: TetR/AcrR family transcriptional regulator [Acetobacteraceae bacterium]|nr:TetR/AcrR family transcriptional regulator [Acetobacteraceae bacterium]
MGRNAAAKNQPAGGGAIRLGRPPRELAALIENRILDAAAKVFLERGFEAASMDEIADVARAGKPTIYARFPGKEALFGAVMAHRLRQKLEESVVASGSTLEERLATIATALLHKVLDPEWVALLRWTIAEARRFPDLARSVNRMARERGTEAIAGILAELAGSDPSLPLPAFAADKINATTQRFVHLVVLPMLIRALFGEDLAVLHAEIGPHVSQAVSFFLAGCRHGGVD